MEQITDEEAVEAARLAIVEADELIDSLIFATSGSNALAPGRSKEVILSTIIMWLQSNVPPEVHTVALARAAMRMEASS